MTLGHYPLNFSTLSSVQEFLIRQVIAQSPYPTLLESSPDVTTAISMLRRSPLLPSLTLKKLQNVVLSSHETPNQSFYDILSTFLYSLLIININCYHIFIKRMTGYWMCSLGTCVILVTSSIVYVVCVIPCVQIYTCKGVTIEGKYQVSGARPCQKVSFDKVAVVHYAFDKCGLVKRSLYMRHAHELNQRRFVYLLLIHWCAITLQHLQLLSRDCEVCAFQIFAKDLIKRTFRSDPPSSYELCIHSRLEAISDSFINTISLYKFDYSFLTAIKTSNRRMRISSSLHSNKTCSFVSGSFPQISIDFDYLLLCILVYRSHSLFHLSMSQQSASRLSRVNIASTLASKTVVCLFSIHF